MQEVPNVASESEILWSLKQRLLRNKSEVYSLKSQLYKARAFYEEENHSLKIQLKSLREELSAVKSENDNLRASLIHSQTDLESLRRQVA